MVVGNFEMNTNENILMEMVSSHDGNRSANGDGQCLVRFANHASEECVISK